jgi:hypothetical protein
MRIALVLVILASGALPAQAHSFFDRWCCSGQDCKPAPVGSVKWTPAGWNVSTPAVQDTVPFDDNRIRYVPPGEPEQQMYICEYPAHRLRCLYVPESGG